MSLPALPHLNLHISVFENAWDNRPTPKCCTLAGLTRALTTFPVIETANKLTLPAWSPARFADGAPRKSAAVRDVSCVVLDFDAGDPDSALSAWTGVLTVLHTTWSHTPGTPRFRLVLPLARPVPLARWSEAWTLAAKRAADVDGACKDPARLYFRPAIARLDAPHFARVQHGDLLDIMVSTPTKSVRIFCAKTGPRRVTECLADAYAGSTVGARQRAWVSGAPTSRKTYDARPVRQGRATPSALASSLVQRARRSPACLGVRANGAAREVDAQERVSRVD